MAIRIPRGYDVNRPYYNEYCEGQRPVLGSTATEAWTGLAHTRVDELHHDPIVIEPGTLVGVITGNATIGEGKLVPAVMGTGIGDVGNLVQYGAANVWGLPTASGSHSVGKVKPLGVCYQPIYSFNLQALYTNYTRNTAVGFVTDYVIQVPAVNSDEWDIEVGDTVILGTGKRHGITFTQPSANATAAYRTYASGLHLAGRYAALKNHTTLDDLAERTVGKCLNRVYLGRDTGATQGDTLADRIAAGTTTFSISTEAQNEWAKLSKIQTVPGLPLTGSGTLGIPGFFLGARADSNKDFWGLTLLIRI
ncbi:MAG: hypothetical protein KDH96_12020 [Candidatus Riesia sp.]|nr:hypothetical protein [Candidatus Riesia sp.]